MNLKKAALITVAAGALGALAVPAMAFENEFHGLYNFNATFSNFQDGGSGDFALYNTAEKKRMNNYFEQRARLQYIAKASDDLKLVTHFEINNRFGRPQVLTQAASTTSAALSTDLGGNDLDSDGLNIVTKHVYLDFNVTPAVNAKLGIMPYKDSIKGIFVDADVPAIMTSAKVGAYTLGLGFSRYNDMAGTTGNTRLGDLDTDLFIMDNTFAINKDTKAGMSYYFLADYKTADKEILLHTLGVNAETKIGPVSLSGFAAMQAGHQKNGVSAGNNTYYHGWAANVAAKAAVGVGTAKAGFLFASGDNNPAAGSNKGWVSTGTNSYNESGMMILARNTGNSPTSTDRYLRRNVTNIALATVGYDANLTKQLFVNGNVGCGWVPSSREGATHVAGDFMGIEANLEAGYKLYDNLTLKAAAGYLFAGGYYSKSTAGDDPENPYTMRLHALDRKSVV